jgi:hypothetical protein
MTIRGARDRSTSSLHALPDSGRAIFRMRKAQTASMPPSYPKSHTLLKTDHVSIRQESRLRWVAICTPCFSLSSALRKRIYVLSGSKKDRGCDISLWRFVIVLSKLHLRRQSSSEALMGMEISKKSDGQPILKQAANALGCVAHREHRFLTRREESSAQRTLSRGGQKGKR